MSDEYFRRVYRFDAAYNAEAKGAPEIGFGWDCEGGGTAGEFFIQWHAFGGKWAPELRAFDDAWAVMLDHFPDFLEWMKAQDNANVSPEAVMEWATSSGCRDTTSYTDPRQKPEGGASHGET